MYNIYCLQNFNNYYNRVIKKYNSISQYIAEYNYFKLSSTNFVPNDGVDTEHVFTIWDETWIPDYILATNENNENEFTRWFVIDAVRLRGKQFRLILRRDLIADHFDLVMDAPCFIEKATLAENDPAIFNLEDMSFNQIKTREILLKDTTEVPWIVGYFARDIEFTEPIASSLTYPVDSLGLGTDTIEEFVRQYENFQGPPTDLNYKTYFATVTYPNEIDVTSYYPNSNTASSQRYRDPSNTSLLFSNGRPTPRAFITAFTNYNTDNLHPENYAEYHTQEELNELLNYDGKIVNTNLGAVYRLSVTVDTTETFTYPIAAGNLFDQLTEIINTLPASVTSQPNSETFTLSYNATIYKITYQRLEEYETSYKFDRSKNIHCVDAPYDIFAIPYGDYTFRVNPTTTIEMNKELALLAVQNFIIKYSQTSLYDVQLLPYCPIQDAINHAGEVYIPADQEDITYTLIKIGTETPVGAFLHIRNSNFSFKLTEYHYTSQNKKIENQTITHRLVSPNFNGQFEINIAKNDGIEYFNVDCSYKPFNPYIHINPDFKGLYGSDYGDARGLICGGDFSLSQISDNWSQYEIQNKNYQVIFNRQMENLSIQQKYERTQDIINAITGTVTGGMAGAMVGAMAGGVPGAIIGGAGGTIGSGAGGVADVLMKEKLRDEAKSLSQDLYGYNLQNIQALPYNLTKVSSFNPNNKIFPILEIYDCTAEEKRAFANKIAYNGMSVGRIGTFNEYINNYWTYHNRKDDIYVQSKGFIKGQIIRLDGLSDDFHIANQIAVELNKGVFI